MEYPYQDQAKFARRGDSWLLPFGYISALVKSWRYITSLTRSVHHFDSMRVSYRTWTTSCISDEWRTGAPGDCEKHADELAEPAPPSSFNAPRKSARRKSIVAVDTLTTLVTFLRLDRKHGDRTRLESLERDRLTGFLAIAVSAIFDALQRRIDLGDKLALAVSGAQFNRPISLRRRAVGEIGVILALVLEMLKRLPGLLEDALPPVEQLQTEILPLTLVHERLFVGGPIEFFFHVNVRPVAVTVLIGLFGGSTVFALRQLHLRLLRAPAIARFPPATRLYIQRPRQ